MNLSELTELGIAAYARGDHSEARRLWEEALAMDPGNKRIESFLETLCAVARRRDPATQPPSPPSQSSGAAAVPLPAPEGDPFAKSGRGAVPLPAPQDDPFANPTYVQVPSPPGDRGGQSGSIDAGYAPSPWDQGPVRNAPVVLGDAEGLDLSTVAETSGVQALVPAVGPSTVGTKGAGELETWLSGARELFALGDFTGSLELIERVLKVEPANAEAREYLVQNEATLIAMYESKLGSIRSIPSLAIKPEEVMWLNLDHRAGFLLAQIDGTVSYEDLFALSGLPRLDTARILAMLLMEGVIQS